VIMGPGRSMDRAGATTSSVGGFVGRSESIQGRQREFAGTLVFGFGLLAAAGLNFTFVGVMGRLLQPAAFATLGVFVASLLAISAPVNALSGGTEMFAALHDRFPRGGRRLWAPCLGAVVWAVTLFSHSATVRGAGWIVLGSGALLLLSWNRGALTGFGRFEFVGASFIVDGAARLVLALVFVGFGFQLQGAAAGLAIGIILALLFTELAVPRGPAGSTTQPLGREVWPALIGLFALGVTQIADVFAIKLANPGQAAPYVAAASMARLALFSQQPAAAYALRRAAVEGPRRAMPRTLALAVVPGLLAIGTIELFPHLLLSVAFGHRYVSAVPTLRILGAAMLCGGLATVAAQMLMGAGATGWAWSITPVAIIGTPAIILLAHVPTSVAWFSLVIQATALIAVGIPTLRLVRARQPGPVRVLILNWRDTRHPQGGGSEVYVEQVARRLAAAGREVTIFCSAHPNAPAREVVDGVRFIRRGGWRTVYIWAFLYHSFGRFGPHDVVVDVKNGIPFLSPAYCSRPVVCLVHHVHEEQWRMNFSPRWARFGWWVESALSPRAYRRSRYITVSQTTRDELAAMGIRASIDLVHNGSEERVPPESKAGSPTLLSLGRLVPHKRVEMVLEVAARLVPSTPDLRVIIVGQGQWQSRLEALAEHLGIDASVTFTGWVDAETKWNLLQDSWVLAMPSVKEGWGLAVMEAAVCGTPSVAFRVGGLEESIIDGETGLLADDLDGFTEAVRTLLLDHDLRRRLGAQAASRAASFSWDQTAIRFDAVLQSLLTFQEVVVVPEDAVPVFEVFEAGTPTAPLVEPGS
jgi:glycosyltransferase involved in cell wall biosynthesis